ncbi:tail assembly chaperone [Paenilisteria rocourtiae]|uniref:Tail assembly chaperone n=1 Tax=Listeria rocourtiae TaxID=647910 RepID=A0A4R6ZR42_9LIST|nr:tail assembly chaperone [Listeria rocourtiae]EUJ44410.1 hypothetical protein PROCOU_13943 [Listeria rocourtiae FSL F6-920]TDR55110.1 tail assembly chaperone [Listeria rocourtiae]
MTSFEINGKEYELKLTFDSINYLNSGEGGALALVGSVFTGDLETYVKIVYAGLKHTGENFTYEAVQNAVEAQIEAEKLDLDKIIKDGNEIVSGSFFYKKTVSKLLKNEAAKEAMEQLLN